MFTDSELRVIARGGKIARKQDLLSHGFVPFPHAFFELGKNEKLVCLALLRHYHYIDDALVCVSVSQLAKLSDLTYRTVIKTLKALEEKEIIGRRKLKDGWFYFFRREAILGLHKGKKKPQVAHL